ncbi:MAG: TolC family protein [Methylococcales symbiont of Hymedesmia sp. n. MRB-2018]|nr:MAG: TolC family protein [Methylococcales symbiont of Hymedesmia sp. n. MRB-2018]
MLIKTKMRFLLTFLSLIYLSSCGIIADYHSPKHSIETPSSWNSTNSKSTAQPQPWLDEFNDSQLDKLINEALKYNYDLKAAAARISSAKALSRINGADRLPQLSTEIRGARQQRNSTGGFSVSNPRSNKFGIDFILSWELDVWGKLKNRAEAAEQDFAASQMDFRAARLSLAANVASFWFKTIESKQQLQLANKKVKAFGEARQIIQDGFVNGINSALDLRLARANVAAATSQRDARQATQDNVLRSLEILLGRYPAAQLITSNTLPELKSQTSVGFPESILRKRPDVLAAEQRLLAADLRFTSAWKNLLPTFSFATSGGTNAAQLRDIFNYQTLIWNIMGNLTQPIFQGGRLIAEKDQANAQSMEAAANYAQTILQAYFEVETSLTAERLLNSQQKSLQLAVDESIEAEQLALEEYSSGLIDMITLLESQRRSYEVQSSLLQVSSQRLLNRITLYLALGGNLQSVPVVAEPAINESFFFSLFN